MREKLQKLNSQGGESEASYSKGKEAGYAVQLSNTTLLDVRPATKYQKAWVKGSAWIPVLDVESTFNVGTLPKKVTNFMMGTVLLYLDGVGYFYTCFVYVDLHFPFNQGGLEAAEEEDLESEGPQPFKFAGIGGLPEFLGWTDQQRAAAAKEGWAYRLVFSARLVAIFIAADALFIGAQEAARYLQDIRSQ
uniref:Rhodanese domain-containing protein n=1 Tax=Daucus carota subsp. sativus TaxID=79200 RepID=A0A161Y1V2_DAUCS